MVHVENFVERFSSEGELTNSIQLKACEELQEILFVFRMGDTRACGYDEGNSVVDSERLLLETG